MKTTEIKRLLIFRPGHLGDTLVALPAIWTLREKLPNARFSFLYNVDRKNPHYITPQIVLNDVGLIDDWIEYPYFEGQSAISKAVSRAMLFLRLRRSKFNAVAYLMPRERTLKQIKRDVDFFKAVGIHKHIGVDHLTRSRFEISGTPASARIPSESDFLVECVTVDGFEAITFDGKDLLRITDVEIQRTQKLIGTPKGTDPKQILVAVAPGSKRPSRMWSEERFADVIRGLMKTHDVFPIFLGSSVERELCERILNACGRGLNAAGKFSIRESAALLKRCTFYLGNDTGTMHLAAAVGTPCVAIFSAADRNGQWEPEGKVHKFFRRSVDCEGCRIDVCPHENFCLLLIEADDVLNACVELIDEKAKP